MNKIVLSLLAVTFPLPAFAEAWEEDLSESGIRVESRAAAGMRVREVRVTSTFEQPAESIFNTLRDVSHLKEIMPSTEAIRVVHRDGDSVWMHVVINPPLVSHRDYCVRTRYTKSGNVFSARWQQTDEYCPPSPTGSIRASDVQGQWLLRAVSPSQTEVLYQGTSDPNGQLTPWIVNRATSRSMIDLFTSLRDKIALAVAVKSAKR